MQHDNEQERVTGATSPRSRERDLEGEWNDMHPARPWADARDYVRHGWDWSRRKD